MLTSLDDLTQFAKIQHQSFFKQYSSLNIKNNNNIRQIPYDACDIVERKCIYVHIFDADAISCKNLCKRNAQKENVKKILLFFSEQCQGYIYY